MTIVTHVAGATWSECLDLRDVLTATTAYTKGSHVWEPASVYCTLIGRRLQMGSALFQATAWLQKESQLQICSEVFPFSSWYNPIGFNRTPSAEVMPQVMVRVDSPRVLTPMIAPRRCCVGLAELWPVVCIVLRVQSL